MRIDWWNRSAVMGGIVVALVIMATPGTHGQIRGELDSIRTLWSNGAYAEVVRRGAQLRDLPNGRMAELDYMLGTSMCRIQGAEQEGCRHLIWCAHRYNSEPTIFGKVLDAAQECVGGSAQGPPMVLVFGKLPSGEGGGSSVHGKMFYDVTRDSAVFNTPLLIAEAIPPERFAARLVPKDSEGPALGAIDSLVGPEFTLSDRGDFIIVSANPQTDIVEMARRLSVYSRFYSSRFGLRMPNWKIAVYVVPDIQMFRELARKIHGIEIQSDAIGYSFQDDLSIVVLCKERYTGTMWHELFHMMARTTFGDIPPWMDEGVAALYEVSALRGDSAVGLRNWRGRLLKKFWNGRPELSRLLAMDWKEFDRLRGESDAMNQAVNHATSRYFALYLQEQGLLSRVVNAIRQQTPATTALPPGEAAIKSIEEICRMSIRDVDHEFASWFQRVEK